MNRHALLLLLFVAPLVMGVSTEGYRSTQGIRAAQEYMRHVRVIFNKRWGAPMQYSRPI